MRYRDLLHMDEQTAAHSELGKRGATDLRDGLLSTARRYGIADIYVFGSRAREIAARVRDGRVSPPTKPEADVDVGVRARQGVRFDVDERVSLTLDLERLFEVRRVDLVVLPEAGAFLALAAVSGELLFCEDSTAQAEYELYVLRRAGDLLPFERDRRELILQKGAR